MPRPVPIMSLVGRQIERTIAGEVEQPQNRGGEDEQTGGESIGPNLRRHSEHPCSDKIAARILALAKPQAARVEPYFAVARSSASLAMASCVKAKAICLRRPVLC